MPDGTKARRRGVNILPYLPPALAERRIRIFMAGHSISVLGSWIQQIALSWLVF